MTDDRISTIEPWYKKTIEHRVRNRMLSFRVSQALFSSHEIDAGTRLLLRSIEDSDLRNAASVLDLGCGYGALGITLAATHPRERVHMVDRDALAVAFAAENAALNGLAFTPDPARTRTDRSSDLSSPVAVNSGFAVVRAYASLGYDDVDDTFDLIAMNVPGKAGDAVIRHLLRGAHRSLAPGGAVAAVAVAPLTPLLASALRDDPAIDVTFERTTTDYVVVHYRFAAPPEPPEPANAFDAGVYVRAHPHVAAGGVSFDLTTVHGLPEFEQPSFATQLLLQELASSPLSSGARIAVVNPGQGHAAVMLHRIAAPALLALVGRDLLALRATAANLAANERDAAMTAVVHDIGIPGPDAPFDLIVATIDDEDPIEASAHVAGEAAAALVPGGVMLVATTSTTAVRLVKRLAGGDVRVVERTRRRGAALLAITRATGQV